MLFAKPLPDELAISHIKRIWAINDYKNGGSYLKLGILAQATRHLRTTDGQPWTGAHTHEILAHLSGMTPAEYRISHTLLALTKNWRDVHNPKPIKATKINVYVLAHFYDDSAAAKSPFRFCRQCRKQDLQRYDMSYRHRKHHIPGVDICPIHHIGLEYELSPHSHFSLNTTSSRSEPVPQPLVQAQKHPILQRYRTLACRILDNSRHIQYAHAGQMLLARASEMGLCRRRLSYSGTGYCLEHELPQFIYTHVPAPWINHHFSLGHTKYIESICSEPEQGHYHFLLNHLDHPASSHPLYLLLALAALFESTDEICATLFKSEDVAINEEICYPDQTLAAT
jgi:hypothetical protein